MVRMRTINEAYEYLKKHDGETAVTCFFIRSLCKQELIRSFKRGNRILVDLDSLISYLEGESS